MQKKKVLLLVLTLVIVITVLSFIGFRLRQVGFAIIESDLNIYSPVDAVYATNVIPINFSVNVDADCFISYSEGFNNNSDSLYMSDWVSLGAINAGSFYSGFQEIGGNNFARVKINCSDGSDEVVKEVNFTIDVPTPSFLHIFNSTNGAVVSSSHEHPSCAVTDAYCSSYTIDGNPNTCSATSTGVFPKYLEYNLTKIENISMIELEAWRSYTPLETWIEVSVDGETFTKVGSNYSFMNQNTGNQFHSYVFSPVEVGYVRIYMGSGGSTYVGFCEVYIYRHAPYIELDSLPDNAASYNFSNISAFPGRLYNPHTDVDYSSEQGFQIPISGKTYGNKNVSFNGVSYVSDFFGNFVINDTVDNGENLINVTQTINNIEHSDSFKVFYDENSYRRYNLALDDIINPFYDLDQGSYTSIFEHPFFKDLKYLNDHYGTKISLYIAYMKNDESWNLGDNMTTYFKDEFEENSDWLKFSYHTCKLEQADTTCGYPNDEIPYNLTKNAVIIFAGENTWSDYTRCHYWWCDSIDRVLLKEQGHEGFMYGPGINDYGGAGIPLAGAGSDFLKYSDAWYKEDEDVIFIHSDVWFDTVGLGEGNVHEDIIKAKETNALWDNYIIDMFTHGTSYFFQYCTYDSPPQPCPSNINQTVKWLYENNYTPVFYDEGFLGSVEINVNADLDSGKVSYNLAGGGVNANCSLVVNDGIIETKVINNKGQIYEFVSSVGLGDEWYVKCTDTDNNVKTSEIEIRNLPVVSFEEPNPENNAVISETSIEINAVILESGLDELVYNWNNVNYSFYDDSLVLMMNFDEYTGMGDTSVYENDGSCASCPVSVSGKYNEGYDFNGDYIEVVDDSSLNFNGPFSIEAWVKYTGLSEENIHTILRKQDGTSQWNGYYLRFVNNSGGYRAQIGVNGDLTVPTIFTYSSSLLDENQWYYLVGVFNGTHVIIYVNGIKDNSTIVSPGDMSGVTNLTIGSYIGVSIPPPKEFFNGTIDEVRIWNRSLLDEEVQQNYFSNLYKYDEDKWALYVNQKKNVEEGLDEGTYTYQVFAKDVDGDIVVEERSVTISLSGENVSEDDDRGGSGLKPIKTYIITEKKLAEGVTKSLREDDRFKFTKQEQGEEKTYYLEVKEISENSVKVFAEGLIDASLNVNEEKKIDSNNDGYYDLSVKLEGISQNKAVLKLQAIYEEIPRIVEEEETKPVVKEEKEVEEEKSKTNYYYLIGLGVVILVVIILIVLVLMKKKVKKMKKKKRK